MEGLSFYISIIGALVGILFLVVSVKASRSLAGSFFKKHYNWMAAGAILLFLGFVTEFLEIFSVSAETVESVHHLLLLAAGIVFVFASLSLPKDASQYMRQNEVK